MPVQPQYNSQRSEQDKQNIDRNSLFTLLQMHPYQYLTTVNKIFSQCNKSSNKSYSQISKIKLPWKQFNLMKIPKYFEQMYSDSIKYNEKKNGLEDEKMDENQKKFWKEHQELIQRFMKNKSIEKQKKQKQRQIYYKKKRPQTAKMGCLQPSNTNLFLKKIMQKTQNISYDRQILKQEVIDKMSKMNIKSTKNSKFVKNTHQKQRPLNQPSLLRKVKSAKPSILKSSHKNNKKAENINNFGEAQQSKISSKNHTLNESILNIQKKANYKTQKKIRGSLFNRQSQSHNIENKQISQILNEISKNSDKTSLLKPQMDFLHYNTTQQIINTYKNKIKQIDCSISAFNVKKTLQLVHNLQQISENLI